MELSSRQIKQFQTKILNWYKVNKRDLPWRRAPYDTRLQQRDPYRILVSEVMLQQTQVSRVIPKYEAWMQRFPDVQSLAQAKVSEVLQYWSGLGYNRRALYLLKCASAVAKAMADKQELTASSPLLLGEGQGEVKWPRTERELMQLPGIGKYTARAILCFAFDKQIAVVDTNIRRVILTQFMTKRLIKGYSFEKGVSLDNPIEQLAEQLLPIGRAYEWNQALMDYSSAMLRNEKIPTRLRLNFGEARQSKFKDSDRFYRGAIIRFLLKRQKLSFKEIANLLAKDTLTIENTRLEKIIEGLQKDRLIIQQKGKNFSLP